MKAIIMAGGSGTRLRPLTCGQPKPMLRILDRPVMEYIINLLKRHDITDISVTLQYLPDNIQEFFGDGSAYGVKLHYFVEESPLGTAGSVKNAAGNQKGDFLVISGDCMTDIDLSAAIAYHKQKKAMATLVLSEVEQPLEYGVVMCDGEGRIQRFIEKPGWSEVCGNTVNTGIYLLSAGALSFIPDNTPFDFSKDLFPLLKERDKPLYGYTAHGYWCDIGDLDSFLQCQFDMLDGRIGYSLPVHETGKGIWTEEAVNLSPDAKVQPPVYLGARCTIEASAVLEPYSIISAGSRVCAGATIKRAVVQRGAVIGKNTALRGCIIGDHTVTGSGCGVYEQAVVADSCHLGKEVQVKAGAKIWPEKQIEDHSQISSNLVWGAHHSNHLFGGRGVTGEANVDITPEFSARLGAAVAQSGKRFASGFDGTAAASMAKDAFDAGMQSTGAEVMDFTALTLPMLRSAIKTYGLAGGVYFHREDSSLTINLLDQNGANINRDSQRKIETAFTRDDFARCNPQEVRTIKTAGNFLPYYRRDVVQSVKSDLLHKKIVVDTSSQIVYNVCKDILLELGCVVTEGTYVPRGALGISIDSKGESAVLTDEMGRTVHHEMYQAIIALITMKSEEGASVVMPVSSPDVLEEIVVKYNGKVIPTKSSDSDIMDKIIENRLFDQFILRYDAIYGFVKILDFLCRQGMELCRLVDEIPDFYMERREVTCPVNAKGRIIQRLAKEYQNGKTEMTEGIKIYQDNGWVLVIPDAKDPSFQLTAQGFDEEYASELCDIFADKIKQIESGGKPVQ